MTFSFGFNQILHSDMEIAGAIAAGDNEAGQRFMRINTGASSQHSNAPLYAFDNDALVFTAPKVASYRCRADGITVNPLPGSDADWVMGLLIATAMPAAIWMQRRFLLHAAAIVPKGARSAIAIAGASGSGKTVLTKQMLEQGASLVADDCVAIDLCEGSIIASGLPGGIHCRIDGGTERRFESLPAAQSVKSMRLGAIIVLDGFTDHFESTLLDKMGALERIISHQHRPRIPTALGISGEILAQAAAVAESIPVHKWRLLKGKCSLTATEQQTLTALLG